jgi:LuxR family transcriptional regulator, maltose regulon positive regulatory protein
VFAWYGYKTHKQMGASVIQPLHSSAGLQHEVLGPELSNLSVDLFESKLHSPLRVAGQVTRTLLLERMHAADDPMVVTVFAAPGFGKTTFLTQWIQSTDRPVAWVSLDEKDNDPLVLLSYITAAFAQLVTVDPRVLEALRSPAPAFHTKVLPRLISAINRVQTPVTLVLDDIHVIHHQACLDALSTLILRLPAHVQIAIAGRTEPSLPLPRLRAQGVVMDIRSRDLAFVVDEADQLLRENDVILPKPDLVDLVDRAEGWPVGIYLAALSIKSGRTPHVVSSVGGDDPYVADYLRTEFLDHRSDDINRFLLHSASVRYMCGGLCDAILDSTDSAANLAALSRENLLVLPLDRQDRWYRYHHLFRELLVAELERTDPGALREARSRAAHWYEKNGDPETALSYAQEADDAEHAAHLFNVVAIDAYRNGRIASVRGWLQWFLDRDVAKNFPLVSLAGAWFLTLTGDAEDAWKLAALSESALDGQTLADGITSGAAWAAQLNAAWCRLGADQMKADAEYALSITSEASPMSPLALLVAGVANMLAGDAELVDEYFADAVEVGARTDTPHALLIASTERAIAATEVGDWRAAGEYIERARETMLAKGLEEYPISAILYATSAHVLAHHGDRAAALEELVITQRLRPQLTYALPWLSVQVRLQAARAYMALADPTGARTVIREAEAVFRRRPDLGILRNQLDELTALVKDAPSAAPGMSSITSAELRVLALLGTHLTFPEIGARLFVSRHTVKSQAISIYRKLGVSSRSEAVLRASQLGLLEG